jgi:hypothetical protein
MPRSAFGFARDDVQQVAISGDFQAPGWGFDPLLDPVSAEQAPYRALVWTVGTGDELTAALSWWDGVRAARQASGRLQEDAAAPLDGVILVVSFSLGSGDRKAIELASRTSAIFVIGPIHRAAQSRTVQSAQSTWPVEVPRLLGGLGSLGRSTTSTRSGVWAWSSVGIEFQIGEDGITARDEAVNRVRRLMRPDGLVDAPPQSSDSVDGIDQPTPVGLNGLPERFESWEAVIAVPPEVTSAVRLDSPAWNQGFAKAGARHRSIRDLRDLSDISSTSAALSKEKFQVIRASGTESCARLRGIANMVVRPGQAAEVRDDFKEQEKRWAELLKAIRAARDRVEVVEARSLEVARARAHFPSWRLRSAIAISVVLFVGVTVSFAIARTPARSFASMFLICGIVGLGAGIGVFFTWNSERNSGDRAVREILRQVGERKRLIAAAGSRAGEVVIEGMKWWVEWRHACARRSLRLSALRVDRCVETAVHLVSGETTLETLSEPTRRYQESSTVAVAVGPSNLPAMYDAPPTIHQLATYPAVSDSQAEFGAIRIEEFSKQLDQRLAGFVASMLRARDFGGTITDAQLQQTFTAIQASLAGLDASDFPGLSVITAPTHGQTVESYDFLVLGSVLHNAVKETGLTPAGWLGNVVPSPLELTSALALDGLMLRLVRISTDADGTAWHEGIHGDGGVR